LAGLRELDARRDGDNLKRADLAAAVSHHFVVRGGLIVRFEQFVDTALVRDAMTV
jgi:ketosteroid isomerase-like protein